MTAIRLLWLCLLYGILGSALRPAHAHDPFDATIEAMVFPGKLEVRLTLGFDATRAFLAAAGVSAEPGQRKQAKPLAPALADRLLEIRAGKGALKASTVSLVAGAGESTILLVYPRPPGDTVQLRARYFEHIAHMRPGTLVLLTGERRLLANARLSKSAPSVTVPLTLAVMSARPR